VLPQQVDWRVILEMKILTVEVGISKVGEDNCTDKVQIITEIQFWRYVSRILERNANVVFA
jgi:hypothetical protein